MRLREFFRRLFRRRRARSGGRADRHPEPQPAAFAQSTGGSSADQLGPSSAPPPPPPAAPPTPSTSVNPAPADAWPEAARLRRLADELLPAPVAAQLLELAQPAIDLVPADIDSNADPACSRIGGQPLLPPALRWPHRDGIPLGFLAQVRLEDVAPYDVDAALPPQGLLLFFYGGAEEAWGFDPDDRRSWRVLLVDPVGARVRAAPAEAEVFTERTVSPQPTLTMPDRWSGPLPALLAAEPAVADVLARFDAGRPSVRHQLLGWAREGHDSMQRVCRLTASGIYAGAGTAGPAPDVRPTELDSAPEWRLLLQLDSDDDAAMVWGDECRLYFWAPPGPFDPSAAWMVWRCG